MTDKPHNYLKYINMRTAENSLFSSFYTEEWEENPDRTPKLGNENLFLELGEDYANLLCHCVTFVYTEAHMDGNGVVVEEFSEKSVRHFIPCDSDTGESLDIVWFKIADAGLSATDSTKFINKDEIALVGYDRTLG